MLGGDQVRPRGRPMDGTDFPQPQALSLDQVRAPAGSRGWISKIEFYAGERKLSGEMFAPYPGRRLAKGDGRQAHRGRPRREARRSVRGHRHRRAGILSAGRSSARPATSSQARHGDACAATMPHAVIRYTTDGTLPTARSRSGLLGAAWRSTKRRRSRPSPFATAWRPVRRPRWSIVRPRRAAQHAALRQQPHRQRRGQIRATRQDGGHDPRHQAASAWAAGWREPCGTRPCSGPAIRTTRRAGRICSPPRTPWAGWRPIPSPRWKRAPPIGRRCGPPWRKSPT